jgi:hypothetical protein
MGICSGYAKMFIEGPGNISPEHYNRVLDFVETGTMHHF